MTSAAASSAILYEFGHDSMFTNLVAPFWCEYDDFIWLFRRRLHQYNFVVVAFDNSSHGILLWQQICAYTNLAGRSLLQFRRQFGSGPITTISTVVPLFEINRVSVKCLSYNFCSYDFGNGFIGHGPILTASPDINLAAILSTTTLGAAPSSAAHVGCSNRELDQKSNNKCFCFIYVGGIFL